MSNQPVNWRTVHLGSRVWCFSRIWHKATVIGLGKNRRERTIVEMRPEDGRIIKRSLTELRTRRDGDDQPAEAIIPNA